MPRIAYVAMGTNLPWGGFAGPELLGRALAALEVAGLYTQKCSSVWRTPPWPAGAQQPDYHNAVVRVDAQQRGPEEIYSILASVEYAFGRERRERRERWEARALDLDIVAIDGSVGKFGSLELPHPRMHERAFVLAPMAELDPAWRHPSLGKSVDEMLDAFGEHDGKRVGPLRMRRT